METNLISQNLTTTIKVENFEKIILSENFKRFIKHIQFAQKSEYTAFFEEKKQRTLFDIWTNSLITGETPALEEIGIKRAALYSYGPTIVYEQVLSHDEKGKLKHGLTSEELKVYSSDRLKKGNINSTLFVIDHYFERIIATLPDLAKLRMEISKGIEVYDSSSLSEKLLVMSNTVQLQRKATEAMLL